MISWAENILTRLTVHYRAMRAHFTRLPEDEAFFTPDYPFLHGSVHGKNWLSDKMSTVRQKIRPLLLAGSFQTQWRDIWLIFIETPPPSLFSVTSLALGFLHRSGFPFPISFLLLPLLILLLPKVLLCFYLGPYKIKFAHISFQISFWRTATTVWNMKVSCDVTGF